MDSRGQKHTILVPARGGPVHVFRVLSETTSGSKRPVTTPEVSATEVLIMKHIRWFPQSGVPKSLVLAVVMSSVLFIHPWFPQSGGPVYAVQADVEPNEPAAYYGFGEIEIVKLDWGIHNLRVVDFNGDGRNPQKIGRAHV